MIRRTSLPSPSQTALNRFSFQMSLLRLAYPDDHHAVIEGQIEELKRMASDEFQPVRS